jgi:glycerol uptake facilitator-like aquaporin
MNKYLAEGIGTMFLVLLACGSAVLAGPQIGVLGIGLCFGLTLLCLCYCIGNISGCHVNPAVSFAMLLSGKLSGKDFIGYVVAQLIGATVGAGPFTPSLTLPRASTSAAPPTSAAATSLLTFFNQALLPEWLS